MSAPSRAAPNHCPYCGEQTLRPTEADSPGDWHCRSCLRLFTVTHHGMHRPPPVGGRA